MISLPQFGQSARAASLTPRQTARGICVASAVAALGVYLASPFVTLWSVGSALHTHDMAALGQVINWGALDASIKHQTLNGLHLIPASDDLPEFGESFAATAVSNAVDTTVTQNNLGMLVDQAIPAAVPVSQPNISFASLAAHASVRFARLDQFVAEVPLPGHERETPLRIEMRIQGWRWKITNVEFPTARAPVLQASAAPSNA
ncbi:MULTISPECIES: DUF2939 domain-containing protein [Acetobacter]|uniref:DUF2939 domain-containing protein n=2 Tax=Acetobacter TaxID=434 RepID=A0AAN1PIW8_9PROT|nr:MULTISPECIES: DUF2939 domain-containing protein [Acetobacter]ASL39596.1 hypothetical protein CBI36_03465 [Acetobacter oryzifermentans]AXN00976.1 DUF2939 domain-containing protein [Acetobacter pomorum]KAA8393146.1 DUF2939 domain-containing protein [Acetobacter sp. DmW_125124]KAA8398602.1 DUF2939 domain-containing protein [Acetobacter sp. DmW_125127]KAA8399136.1 DUF2939 domain-containing protein [Acetobacter sp. DmW_125128]